jgi:hypothetical protein
MIVSFIQLIRASRFVIFNSSGEEVRRRVGEEGRRKKIKPRVAPQPDFCASPS